MIVRVTPSGPPNGPQLVAVSVLREDCRDYQPDRDADCENSTDHRDLPTMLIELPGQARTEEPLKVRLAAPVGNKEMGSA